MPELNNLKILQRAIPPSLPPPWLLLSGSLGRFIKEGGPPASMFLSLPDRHEHVQTLHLSEYAEGIVGPSGARDAVASNGSASGAQSLDADRLSMATTSIGGNSEENTVNNSNNSSSSSISSNNSASVTGTVSSIVCGATVSTPPCSYPRASGTLTFTPSGDSNSCATIPSAGVCSPSSRRSHVNFSRRSGADNSFSSSGFFKAPCCEESFDGTSEAHNGVCADDERLHAPGTAAMAGMPVAAADAVEGAGGEHGRVGGFGLIQPDNVRREGSVTFWMGTAGGNNNGVHNDDDNDNAGVVEKQRCEGVDHDDSVSREVNYSGACHLIMIIDNVQPTAVICISVASFSRRSVFALFV